VTAETYIVIMLASSYLARCYEKHGIGRDAKAYEHLVVKRMGLGDFQANRVESDRTTSDNYSTACQHLAVKSRSKNVPLEYDRGKIFFRQSGEEIQENTRRGVIRTRESLWKRFSHVTISISPIRDFHWYLRAPV
jgi:hypothetical protein